MLLGLYWLISFCADIESVMNNNAIAKNSFFMTNNVF